jgi:hypothetical protein
MKITNKIISIILISIICFAFVPKNISLAATETTLITVGTGIYKITVTNNTSINEIEKVLGKSKLTTKSAFGGNCYTFYTDDDYNNYLYIETNSKR